LATPTDRRPALTRRGARPGPGRGTWRPAVTRTPPRGSARGPPGGGPVGGHTIRQKGARRRRPQPAPALAGCPARRKDLRPHARGVPTHAGDVFIRGGVADSLAITAPRPARADTCQPYNSLAHADAFRARDSLANKP
jgi:hypothetical protein